MTSIKGKQPEGGEYPCGFCDKVLNLKHHLDAHILSHTKEKSYKCSECDKTYRYSGGLKYHIDTVHTNRKYTCPVENCGQKLASKVSLYQHHRAKHDPNSDLHTKVECPICKQKVKKISLGSHVFKHKEENKKHKCGTCGKGFLTAQYLMNHERTHLPQDERPVFSCDFCDAMFKNSTTLKQHKKRKHSLNPPQKCFLCPFCVKKFNYKQGLEKHLPVHTGEKPHSCTQCDKSFIERKSLTSHLLVHHGIGDKYKCTHCDRSFNYKSSLMVHLAQRSGFENSEPCPNPEKVFVAKPSPKGYPCNLCNKYFATSSRLKRHAVTHSDARPYACTKCEKAYSSKGTLTLHMFKHSNKKFTCNICSRSYSGPQYLQGHIKSKHRELDDRFKCQFCGAKFLSGYKLNRHMQSHLGEKVLSCNQCTMTFNEKSELKKHLSNVHKNGAFNRRRIYHTGKSSFKCNHCSSIFSSMTAWGQHVQKHPEFRKSREIGECKRSTNYTCRHCTKSFYASTYLVQHLTTHRLELEFKCKPCVVLVRRLD